MADTAPRPATTPLARRLSTRRPALVPTHADPAHPEGGASHQIEADLQGLPRFAVQARVVRTHAPITTTTTTAPFNRPSPTPPYHQSHTRYHLPSPTSTTTRIRRWGAALTGSLPLCCGIGRPAVSAEVAAEVRSELARYHRTPTDKSGSCSRTPPPYRSRPTHLSLV